MLFVIFGYINEIDLSPSIIYKANINNLQEKNVTHKNYKCMEHMKMIHKS